MTHPLETPFKVFLGAVFSLAAYGGWRKWLEAKQAREKARER